MIVFEAIVTDHTGLGGPMGSERVWLIERTLHAERESALNHLRTWINNERPWVAKNIPTRWSGTPLDLGCVGIEVQHKTVNALKRPTRRTG